MSNTTNVPITIVLPTYNRAHLLPDVLISIQQQEMVDFELLIVDDGSTDDTVPFVQKTQQTDERIKLLVLGQNRGLGNAREAGRLLVTSPLMALADSDDPWPPHKLRLQYEIMNRHPQIDLLFTDFTNIDHISNTQSTNYENKLKQFGSLPKEKVTEKLWILNGLERSLLQGNIIGAPTLLIRNSIFEKVGGFNKELMAVDLEFAWRAALLGAKIGYLHESLLERHVHTDSLTTLGGKPQRERLQALDEIHTLAVEKGRFDLIPDIKTAYINTIRQQILRHGSVGERLAVTAAYRHSLKYGFSPKTLIFFLLSLLGPFSLNLALRQSGLKK